MKINNLSYRLDGEMRHCMEYMGADHGSLDPNPATVHDLSNVQLSDVLPGAVLEMDNFDYFTMTRQGTVLYMQQLKRWFVVTQGYLNAGLITIVDFKNHGQVDLSFRQRAYNMYPVYLDLFSLRKSLQEVADDRVGGQHYMNTEYVELTNV